MTASSLGRLFIDGALVAFLVGVVVQGVRIRRSTSGSSLPIALVGLGSTFAAVVVMQVALLTHNFNLSYVAENNATFTPTIYSMTGMWSALEGSILLWALLLALLLVVVVIRYRHDAADRVVQWATLVFFAVAAFFVGLMAGPADPFVPNPVHSSQGAGPNALLQNNPLVAAHPPLLYAGFVGFTVPFVFAVAMLITGRVDERWPIRLRQWTVLAWGILSVGIVLGAWWSYQVLGWGGFWGWDPVENAALLPWLTATAYVHSIIVQDRRGLFRVWNLSLAIATFALTILGTFFTRSGVLQSVHAFSSSTLGPILIGFFAVTVGGGTALIAWRGDRLRSPVGVDAALSREGLFVANNILFVGFAIVVLVGTAFPLLYEAINGGQVTVGAPYFAKVSVPVGVLVLTLMALAPLAGWRKTDRNVLWGRVRASAWFALAVVVATWLAGIHRPALLLAYFLAAAAGGSALRTLSGSVRSARLRGDHLLRGLLGPTAGGMVVHLGVVMLALGIVSSTTLATKTEVALAQGQSTVVAGERITYLGLHDVRNELRDATELSVRVNGQSPLHPAITTFHGRDGQTVGTPAISSNFWRDVYLTFDAVGGTGTSAGAQVANDLPAGSVVLGVTVEPLLVWLWLGGLTIGFGSLLSFVRRREDVK
jgi:cytochrome c-type biogenesis protein CcmF